MAEGRTSISKKEARLRSAHIDEQLKRDARLEKEKGGKMLLLGSGDSGKSTLLKQMRILHSTGFTAEERSSYKLVIFGNIVDSIQLIIRGIQQANVKIGSENIRGAMKTVLEHNFKDGIPPDLAAAIKLVWQQPQVKDSMKLAKQFHVQDTAAYFLDQIDHIVTSDYKPNDQDILCCRLKTLSVSETNVTVGTKPFRIYDVGGQKSSRLFWIPYFSCDVKAIIFIAALSGYDQKMEEDPEMNRMVDSITLFGQIMDTASLKHVAMILFLNKSDLFEEKFQYSPIKDHFPEFTEQQKDIKVGKRFFRKKFECLQRDPNRNLYVHFTTNTDTKLMKFIIAAVTDIIIKLNMNESGMLV